MELTNRAFIVGKKKWGFVTQAKKEILMVGWYLFQCYKMNGADRENMGLMPDREKKERFCSCHGHVCAKDGEENANYVWRGWHHRVMPPISQQFTVGTCVSCSSSSQMHAWAYEGGTPRNLPVRPSQHIYFTKGSLVLTFKFQDGFVVVQYAN